jgi:polysaccharide export outer membrane protein
LLYYPEVMNRINTFISLILLLGATSCTKPCCDYNVVGADEFVIDSYQIRHGKLAILELMGEDIGCFPEDALEEYDDVISEGDVFNIALYHPTRVDLREAFEYINNAMGGFIVKNGKIELPDIPPVYVEGLTKEAAKEKINDEYKNHYQDAEIFLSYNDRTRQRVELAGNVSVNSIPVDGKMRLYEVLSLAKYNPQANLFMSYVMRDGKRLAVDIYRLINLGDMQQNIVMKGGDKIYIANAHDATVIVMGEVGHPHSINVPYGFITLPEALVAAGGIPFTGDRNCIQIIRGDLADPKIYVVSWDHVINLPNNSMLLMPGDTIFVSEKPITIWNRFISQLLPTASAIQLGHGTYRLFNPIIVE